MLMSLLFAGRFQDYVDAVRRDAGLWLFVHVPKTAGSSLASELARLAPPYHNIDINHADTTTPAIAQYDAAVEQFLFDRAKRAFRSASGHLLQRHVAQIAAAESSLRSVTFLREPVQRLVSDYRYQRSPMHPLHLEARRRAPDFAAFLDLAGPRNRMAKHMVPIEMVQKNRIQDAISFALNHFAFIGLQERYVQCFRLLTLLVTGGVVDPTERRRVNEVSDEVVLTPEIEAYARERNALDCAIYATLAEQYARIEPAFFRWLEHKALIAPQQQ